jgi:hypothetical protein
VIRERNGRTLPGVFHSEVEALAFIRRQVPRGTELYADEASAWNTLHAATPCTGSTTTKPTAWARIRDQHEFSRKLLQSHATR